MRTTRQLVASVPLLLLLLLPILALGGCKPDADSADRKAKAPAVEAPRLDPVKPAAASKPEPPPMEQRRKRDILVGGCNDDCDEPKEALENFLKACVHQTGEADLWINSVRSYVNTAALVANGVRHGDQWAQLFMERRLGKRRQQIDIWLNEWLAWVDRLHDPADRLRITDGVTVREQNQKRFVVDWTHPDLKPAPNSEPTGPIWRIELRKRGLEWLVAEIQERP